MDAVTYPDARTVRFVNERMIPLAVNVKENRGLPMDYQIKYTPTTLTLNDEGKEQERLVGFKPPEQFIPALMLADGKSHFNERRYDRARDVFKTLLEEFPDSEVAATARNLSEASEKRLTEQDS